MVRCRCVQRWGAGDAVVRLPSIRRGIVRAALRSAFSPTFFVSGASKRPLNDCHGCGRTFRDSGGAFAIVVDEECVQRHLHLVDGLAPNMRCLHKRMPVEQCTVEPLHGGVRLRPASLRGGVSSRGLYTPGVRRCSGTVIRNSGRSLWPTGSHQG